jgi:hypothetical protein
MRKNVKLLDMNVLYEIGNNKPTKMEKIKTANRDTLSHSCINYSFQSRCLSTPTYHTLFNQIILLW